MKIAFFTAEILPNVGEGINASPALADVDGDGTLEVGVFSAAGPGLSAERRRHVLLRLRPERLQGDADRGRHLDEPRHCRRFPALGEGAFGDLTGTGAGR